MATGERLSDASRASDSDNAPYAGAKWSFYATGTLTPENVFSDAALTTSLGSEVTADLGGKFVPIYFDSSKTYRGILTNADDSETIYDIDPINAGILAALSANDGAASIGTASGKTLQETLNQMDDNLLNYASSVADGIASNKAAFDALIAAGGGLVPKQAQPYVIDSAVTLSAGLKFEPGVEIEWTGDVAGSYSGVFIADSASSLSVNGGVGEVLVYSEVEDKLRFAVYAEEKDGITIQGVMARNMGHAYVTSTTETYGDVVTSGGSANISSNIHIWGGGAYYDTMPTGVQTHAACSIFFTENWSVWNARYTNVTAGVQWWGGDANGDGAIANERKCKNGSVRSTTVNGCLGGGIWGSMGEDLEISDCQGRNAGDVGFDSEGGNRVRFNDCTWTDAVSGAGAAFYLNRGLEFNNCLFHSTDADNIVWACSNPAQSNDNMDITFNDCTWLCTDSTPGRIITAAARNWKITGRFDNVIADFYANNNHNIEFDASINLPVAGGTPSSVITAALDDVVTHSIGSLPNLARVRFTTTGTLPAGLSTGTDYYITPVTGTTCKVSTSLGNAAKGSPVFVDITDTGTGVHTMQIALAAVRLGSNTQIAGVAGRVTAVARVKSAATQAAGSYAVHISQQDPNASPLSILHDCVIENMPGDILLTWGGNNAGTSGHFHLLNNTSNNVITPVQNDAANAGTFVYTDNRTPTGVMFDRSAAITDPAGGATIDAEARTAINAIIDAMQKRGFVA